MPGSNPENGNGPHAIKYIASAPQIRLASWRPKASFSYSYGLHLPHWAILKVFRVKSGEAVNRVKMGVKSPVVKGNRPTRRENPPFRSASLPATGPSRAAGGIGGAGRQDACNGPREPRNRQAGGCSPTELASWPSQPPVRLPVSIPTWISWRLGRRSQSPQPLTPAGGSMLRHAAGYKLANDGQDTRAIQHYLGHRNISHTVRYTELSPERFKDFWQD